MTFDQIVTAIALLVGPSLAVGITIAVQRYNLIRAPRLYVFQTLMAYRSDQFNAERIKALALIDVYFHDVPIVRAKWKEYFDSLNDPIYSDGKNDAVNVWRKRQNALLAEMGQFLGYGRNIKYEEIDRVYAPVLFLNNALASQKAAAEWLRVLESSENLGHPRKPHK